jgi:hypothetical protein
MLIKRIIILLLFSNTVNAQKRDTLLIKYFKNDIEQIVFIDTPNSIYHHKTLELLNDKRMYMKSTTPSYGNNLFNNGEWISVKYFKKKYYAYFPSEPYANTYLFINEDSITVNDFNEGLITYKITKRNANKKRVNVYFENLDKTSSSFRFKRINNEFMSLKSSYFGNNKSVFITETNKFFSIPIIVNFCPDNRCPEFFVN